MSVERIGTTQRMSKINKYNDTVYLCGMVAKDAETDIREQARTMLENVDEALAEAGTTREKMLSATIYIRDMKDFAAMNEVWDAWVPEGEAPARACVEARLANPLYLVEVSIVAALG